MGREMGEDTEEGGVTGGTKKGEKIGVVGMEVGMEREKGGWGWGVEVSPKGNDPANELSGPIIIGRT